MTITSLRLGATAGGRTFVCQNPQVTGIVFWDRQFGNLNGRSVNEARLNISSGENYSDEPRPARAIGPLTGPTRTNRLYRVSLTVLS